MKAIPIEAAKRIADVYGYDQVIIIARKVGEGGGEHCTTYGVDQANCNVAARCGDFLKYEVMGWHQEQTASAQSDNECPKCRYKLDSIAHLELCGHGHVVKRVDGDVHRCGGPRFCKACAADKAVLRLSRRQNL